MHGQQNVKKKLVLLHLVCCLCYCINDARSHKHQKVLCTSRLDNPLQVGTCATWFDVQNLRVLPIQCILRECRDDCKAAIFFFECNMSLKLCYFVFGDFVCLL